MSDKFTLINLGYNPWTQYWKRNQIIFARLAREPFISEALFVNPSLYLVDLILAPGTVLRAPDVYKWRHVLTTRVGNSLRVFTPIVLPASGRLRVLDRANQALNRSAMSLSGQRYLLLLNDPRPEALRIAECVRRSRPTTLIFDYSDDFVEFAGTREERHRLAAACEKACRDADMVVTISDRLTERAKRVTSSAHTVSNATNYFAWPRLRQTNAVRRRFNGPLVGYLGWLNADRLDNEMICYAARRLPDSNFVFMGPHSHRHPLGKASDLPRNVHILPPVPASHVPGVLEQFDVCILPNRLNSHTNGNDPIKVFDYLASGVPVVSTRTAGTERVASHLRLVDSKEEFVEALTAAFQDRDDDARRSRIQTALSNSWDHRYVEFRTLLLALLRR